MTSRLLLLLLVSAALIGCTTKPISTQEMKQPPDKRIIDGRLFQARPGTLPVVIKRDAEFRIMPCMVRVSVDKLAVADLAPGEGITLHIDKGERFLVAHFCPDVGGGEIIELFVRVEEEAHATFRISGEGGGTGITFQPTQF
jgi:hypothetical protein